MKRTLSIILCTILLLGLLPMEAKALDSAFHVSVNTFSAYVGDTLKWEIIVDHGEYPFKYSFHVFRDGKDYLPEAAWLDSTIYTFKPTLPGWYTIIAGVKNYSGSLHYQDGPITYVSLRVPVITSVTAVNGTSLKISWNKVPGAKLYTIARNTIKENDIGNYDKVTETTATTFTDKNRKTGIRYYYRVIASMVDANYTKYSSGFSSDVAGVPLDKAIIKSVVPSSAGRLTITWGKVPNASGYQVLRSTSAEGIYSTVAKAITATSFINTGLTKGKIYYYKVLPYKRIVTTNYYGPLSAYKFGKAQ